MFQSQVDHVATAPDPKSYDGREKQADYSAAPDHELSQLLPAPISLLGGASYTSCGKRKRKRKAQRCRSSWEQPPVLNDIDAAQTAGIELQPKDPLPPDWEQCLDLHSGRMFYLNKRTLRRSWEWPRGTAPSIDLELNISAPTGCGGGAERRSTAGYRCWEEQGNPSGNMIAVPCLNCHLLVMLCTSSPSCPNCKYVHSLPAHQTPPPPPPPPPTAPPSTSLTSDLPGRSGGAPLQTLSLLN